MNGETAAISEINFIRIEFENLRLSETMFELEGHHGLGDLAPEGSVDAGEKAARHLHRDRASALDASAVAHISTCGAENTRGIEAGMLEETPVFDGKHGFAQQLGNVIEVHVPALLARTVEQTAQEFRLDLGGINGRACVQHANFLDLVPAESDHKPVFAAKIRLTRSANFDFGAVQDVAPGLPLHMVLAITGGC